MSRPPVIATSSRRGSFSSHGSGKKRKRANSASSNNRPAKSPRDTTAPVEGIINPLSHPPSVVSQFLVAGLDIDAPLPSKIYPGFPHRPIPDPLPPPSSKPERIGRRREAKRLSRIQKWAHFYTSDEGGGAASSAAAATNTDGGGETTATNATETTAVTEGWDDSDDSDPEARRARGRRKRKKAEKQEDPNRRRLKSRVKREPGVHAAEKAHYHQKAVGPLLAIIKSGLVDGEIKPARRAFAALLGSEVRGVPIDLRYNEYWRLGLEILLRESEEEERKWRRRRERRKAGTEAVALEDEGEEDEGALIDEDGEDDDEEAEYKYTRRRRANLLEKVKLYYESLIGKYPYHSNRPTAVSALLYYPAMFRFELDDVRREHALELKRLERLRRHGAVVSDEGEVDDDGYNYDDPMEFDPYSQDYGYENPDYADRDEEQYSAAMNNGGSSSKPKGIIDRPVDSIRKRALGRLEQIAHRIDDSLLPNLPYRKDYALFSLRAEIALQVADLSVPVLYTHPQSQEEEISGEAHEEGSEEERRQLQEGEAARRKQLNKALKLLNKIKKEIRVKAPLDVKEEELLEQVRRELGLDEERGPQKTAESAGPAAVASSQVTEREDDDTASEEDGAGVDGDDEAGHTDNPSSGKNDGTGRKRKNKKRKKSKRGKGDGRASHSQSSGRRSHS